MMYDSVEADNLQDKVAHPLDGLTIDTHNSRKMVSVAHPFDGLTIDTHNSRKMVWANRNANECCCRPGRRSCGKPKCSVECRAKWARRWAIVQRQSYQTLPPQWFVRLTPVDDLSSRQFDWDKWAKELGKLHDRLSYHGISWLQIHEWSPEGRYHVQLLLRTQADERMLRRLIAKTKGLATYYLKPVDNATAVAKYVAKDLKDKSKLVVVPREFKGRAITYSAGYFDGKPKELIQAFFAAKQAAGCQEPPLPITSPDFDAEWPCPPWRANALPLRLEAAGWARAGRSNELIEAATLLLSGCTIDGLEGLSRPPPCFARW